MSNTSGRIYDPDAEQFTLVEPPRELKRTLGGFSVDVPVGKQYRLFRNGAFVRDLPPGRHVERDLSPFVKYTVSVVDARVHTTPTIVAVGSIPGEPGMPPCRIQIPLKLTYQLQDITILLMTVDPLTQLELITKNQAATQISYLRYREYTEWATKLRDELQRWLVINATARTGLQILDVLIAGEARGENEADRLMLKKFTTIQEIEIEDLRAEADRRNQLKDAYTIAQKAGAVGLDPAELGLAQMPGGQTILEAHLRQEETRINALGIAGAQPLIREYVPPQAALPAPPDSPAAIPAPGGRVTPDFPTDVSGPSQSGSMQGAPAQSEPAGATLDMDRVNAEIAFLEKQGYSVQHGAAQANNAQGGVSYGYKVTVFPGDPSRSAWKFVQFELGPGYPQTVPVVTMAREGAAPNRWNDYILQNWKNYTRLTDVVDAALRTV